MKKKNQKKQPRRAALVNIGGAFVATSMLPSKWITPVINAVVLPAHGQMSEVIPVRAKLSGVVDGLIATNFTVDASASSGPVGATLNFTFTVDGGCILLSQSGPQAIIQRGLIAGVCTVKVTVSDGTDSDSETIEVQVTGGPPPPPTT